MKKWSDDVSVMVWGQVKDIMLSCFYETVCCPLYQDKEEV